MRFARWGLVVVAIICGLPRLGPLDALGAQDRAGKAQPRAKGEAAAPRAAGSPVSLQDAMLRPFDLPFGEETTLEEVRQHLARTLGAQVILDRAALDRLELDPGDTVQLDLKGVRLKVGLKLLLDQVGLAYRVIPEDNLLILTEPESSDDPAVRVLAVGSRRCTGNFTTSRDRRRRTPRPRRGRTRHRARADEAPHDDRRARTAEGLNEADSLWLPPIVLRPESGADGTSPEER